MTERSAPSGSESSGVRIFPPAVYVGGLIVGYAIQWFVPISIAGGTFAIAVRALGAIAIAAALLLDASALACFRRNATPVNPTKPTAKLVRAGPYRFTRNPMYLGLALLHGGLALIGNALWPLLALVPAIWIIRTQVIAREEAYLEAKFGEDYRAYKAAVRRWF